MSIESLPYKTPIDLSNCEKEPIHIPGQIQAHGALWVVDRQTRRIVQVSSNIAQFVGKMVDEDHPILEARLPDGRRGRFVIDTAAASCGLPADRYAGLRESETGTGPNIFDASALPVCPVIRRPGMGIRAAFPAHAASRRGGCCVAAAWAPGPAARRERTGDSAGRESGC